MLTVTTEDAQSGTERSVPPRKTRAVRIEDPLWQAAMARAAERGETVTDVIRRALRRYIGED